MNTIETMIGESAREEEEVVGVGVGVGVGAAMICRVVCAVQAGEVGLLRTYAINTTSTRKNGEKASTEEELEEEREERKNGQMIAMTMTMGAGAGGELRREEENAMMTTMAMMIGGEGVTLALGRLRGKGEENGPRTAGTQTDAI